MADCIFCKLVGKEIPNYTVYEDDGVLAFLDIHPQTKGHTVVIPKRHSEVVFDLSSEEISQLFNGTHQAMKRLQSVLAPDGFTTGWNHGRAGGQAIGHMHVHIFPRWHNDGGTSMHAVVKNPGDKTVGEIAKLFQEKL